MIDEIGEWVRGSTPGTVSEADYDGFNLSIGGGNWGLGATSPWRIVRDGGLVAGCGDSAAAKETLDLLLGVALEDVLPQSTSMLGDPVLIFTGGIRLEVFSDTQIDPWTFVLPHMVYVGTPGDSRYNQ